jgi:excinuclease ABC subunit C
MSSDDAPVNHIGDRFNESRATFTLQGAEQPDIEVGIAAIKMVVATLPLRPGVYRMLDARGEVLYVGKARALKNRVSNYTRMEGNPKRIQRMIALTRSMQIVTTESEAEALLLEAQLIKHYRPAFNVLLRDDKSFPYILLREDHAYARLTKHRGARTAKGQYYGPFSSGGAVNATLNALERLFLLRSCTDSYFNNRDRPCLLYQIKRCSGPCCGRVSPEAYAELVGDAKAFLSGKATGVQAKLAVQMERASEALDYEMAVIYRDRLKALTAIQARQAINPQGLADADIFAMARQGDSVCIQAFFIRGGQNWGHRAFFPQHAAGYADDEVLASAIAQLYTHTQPPRLILTDRMLPESALFTEALAAKAGGRVQFHVPKRGDQTKLIEIAVRNAGEALERRLAESSAQGKVLRELAELLDLDAPPERIEVYDNSHIQGTNALGGMIAAGPEGFLTSAYRKWNIKDSRTVPGDDYGMMREVFTRRFGRLLADAETAAAHSPSRPPIEYPVGRSEGGVGRNRDEEENWPDLVLIDGGKGQVSAVKAVFAELGIDDVPYVGVAKGPDRNAGREVFHFPDGREASLPANHPVLFYLQRLRDEAHRFAIGAHRKKRTAAIGVSTLDQVPGIGPARKKALLMHFGTAKAVRNASLDDLCRAPGVSKAMAQVVYDYYHG